MQQNIHNIDIDGNNVEYLTLRHWFPWFRKNFLWIHGFCAPFQDQEKILRGIYNQGYNVYAFNLPGHGNSEKVTPITWELMQSWAKELIENVWQLRELQIGAYSMGAGLALQLAQLYPDRRVTELRLDAPFCATNSILHTGTGFGYVKYLEHRREILKNSPFPKPLGASFIWCAEHYLRPIVNFNVDFSKITQPTKILIHENDEVLNNPLVCEILSQLKNQQTIFLSNFGHDVYYIDPGHVSSLVNHLA